MSCTLNPHFILKVCVSVDVDDCIFVLIVVWSFNDEFNVYHMVWII